MIRTMTLTLTSMCVLFHALPAFRSGQLLATRSLRTLIERTEKCIEYNTGFLRQVQNYRRTEKNIVESR